MRRPAAPTRIFLATLAILCATIYLKAQTTSSLLEQLESSARRDPSVTRWLEVASACTGELCTFNALQKAIALDKNNAEANTRLAEYYIRRDQHELARAALNVALATAPADLKANLALARLDLKIGDTVGAYRWYRWLEQNSGDDSAILYEIASGYERLGLITDAKHVASRLLKITRTDSQAHAIAIRLGERSRDPHFLLQAYQQVLTVQPDDVAAIVNAAKLEKSIGNRQKAEQRLKAALERKPEDDVLKATLAEVRAEHKASGYAGYVTTSSESARLRTAWLTGKFQSADPDTPFLANVEESVKSATNATSATTVTDADAEYLADVRIDRVRENGLVESRVQQLIYIATDVGAKRYATRKIQYSPMSESLAVVRAVLHKADGRVLNAEDDGDERVADVSTAMYYDVRSRVLRFSTAEPGDVVELDYRTTPATDNNPYGDYFASFQTFAADIPTRLKRYVAVVPAERTFYATQHELVEPRQQVDGELRTFVWEQQGLAAVSHEPLAPPTTEYAPYAHISTLRNQNELGQWYAQLIAPQMELSEELRQVAMKIAYANPEPRDRVNAVYQFVLTNTHYVALEFGIYSYKPYPVSQVYARRFGDCKDKASLMIAMLRAVGVDAEIALVRTRSLGPIKEDAASIAMFNHAIVYVPQYNLWLDGTADYFEMRELPADDQGAMAVTVAVDGRATMRTVPISSADQNSTDRRVSAQVDRNGTIRFRGTTTTRGGEAPALRRDFEVAERQRESVRRALADVFPTVQLDEVKVDNALRDRGVGVEFGGTLDSFSGHKVVSLRNTWTQRDYLQRLALLRERSHDVVIGAPWSTAESFAFDLPAGARIAEMPANVRMATDFGKATLTYSIQGSRLTIDTRVDITATRVSVAHYNEFREFCAALDRAFRQDVKVVLP